MIDRHSMITGRVGQGCTRIGGTSGEAATLIVWAAVRPRRESPAPRPARSASAGTTAWWVDDEIGGQFGLGEGPDVRFGSRCSAT
jgi:hypothetical protein